MKTKRKIVNERISGRVLPGLPPQKLTAIFGAPSRPVTRPEMFTAYTTINTTTTIFITIVTIISILLCSVICLIICSAILFSNTTNVSALSYQSNTGVQFTINPTITISITGDHNGNLVINNLTPSNASDSNIITITTSSNAIAGYGLYSTVGSDSNGTSTGNPSTELRRNGTDTTNKFTSITTNKSSLSDFNGSDWGYSYCNGDNTICTISSDNWVSGNTGSTLSGYNGLPLYDNSSSSNNNNNNGSNNTAGIKLVDTTTSGTTTISFKIGAKASNSQIAGDYTNTINFIGVAKPNPEIPYMQNLDSTLCTTNPRTVIDSRDNQYYLIARLADNNCWMLDNLRLDLTNPTILNGLTTTNTHVDETSLTSLKYGNRSAGDRYASGAIVTNWSPSATTDYYNQAAVGVKGSVTEGVNNNKWTGSFTPDTIAPVTYGNGSGKIGVYYNYCAASAGNYCYNRGSGVDDTSTLQDAQYDICPKGWRMPTSTSDGEYQALYTAYSSDQATFKAALSTSLFGRYSNGVAYDQGTYGYFWSSTWYGGNHMIRLYMGISEVSPSGGGGYRYNGFSVRCLLDS